MHLAVSLPQFLGLLAPEGIDILESCWYYPLSTPNAEKELDVTQLRYLYIYLLVSVVLVLSKAVTGLYYVPNSKPSRHGRLVQHMCIDDELIYFLASRSRAPMGSLTRQNLISLI